MDTARGGYFEEGQDTYPDGAWFTNTESSCDYACQLDIYVWYLLSTYYGLNEASSGYAGSHSSYWTITTSADLETTDPLGFALMNYPFYTMPT